MPHNAPGKYDRVTIAIHWIVAALVLSQWCGGQTIDWFTKGDARVAARSFHILFGTTLAILIVWRIVWRAKFGVRLPAAAAGVAGNAAKTMHYALYFAMISVVTLGLVSVTLRGDSIFGLFHVPHPAVYSDAARHALANKAVNWHGFAANSILALAGVHAVSGLLHHYLFPGKVLYRMGLS